jgi:CDP-glycerol glycerophosphotransferase
LFNNVNFPPPYRKRSGSVFVQTHHGTPLKAMGMDHYRWPVGGRGMDLDMLLKRCRLWDYSLTTSAFNTEVWGRAYPANYSSLEFGYPRNDILDRSTPADVAAARAVLGVRDDEQVVLYAPTHREYQAGFDPSLDADALAEALGPKVRVLLRAHHLYSATGTSNGAHDWHPRVLDVSTWPSIEELCLASDALITDYSSLMFDYAHLDRPIVIYAPDWETYKLTRGVTFDLFATPPGVVATTFSDLVTAFMIGEVSSEGATKARTQFRDRFCPHRDGTAGERVVRYVMLGERTLAASPRIPRKRISDADEHRGSAIPRQAPSRMDPSGALR